MTPNTSSRPGRKTVFAHAYDWVNNSDLTQLDAIMLAIFVFIVGLCILGGMFVLGKLETLTQAVGSQYAQRTQALRLPVHAQALRLPVQASAFRLSPQAVTMGVYGHSLIMPPDTVPGGQPVPGIFGRPRSDAASDRTPFRFSRYGQAEAAVDTLYH